jgi:protein-disulfide isomerase
MMEVLKQKEAARVNLKTMAAAVAMWAMACGVMSAQTGPVLSPATAQAEQAAEPSAPAPKVPSLAKRFPPVDPKNFTATSPTVDEVNSFLKAIWGYDENRIWSVAGILKTPAPGISKVVVFVGDESNPARTSETAFFVTPDGKHAIADQVIDFGVKPFAEKRAMLQEKVDGPAEGAKGKDLLLVEFGDLQCAKCKDAQDSMNNLIQDFPAARIVFQTIPIAPERVVATKAAAEGICVRKAKGDAAYFTYAQFVYSHQAGLTTEGVDATLAAAAGAAGADSAAAAACAATPATKAAIVAAGALAADMGIDVGPTLVVNGHALPLGNMSYETLKRIVAYQAQQDGVIVHVQPTLSTLK